MHEEDEQGLLSPTNSPRLRQTTFGATLDFVEALCTASSGLTSFAHEDRQWALCRCVEWRNKGEAAVMRRYKGEVFGSC